MFVKQRAVELFRAKLCENRWSPETIVLSGVTDCYQPAERRFRLTRGCLEVALEARQPISIITKNALIERDLDILSEMASLRLVNVSISFTSMDQSLTKDMEPQTSTPAARLRAIKSLSESGIPVNVMVAPVIPGLNDSEIPAILEAVHDAGAASAQCILLRLPLTVAPVFLEWLERMRPLHKNRIESLVRSTRNGKLNSAKFGERMRGDGALAEQIRQTFVVFARRLGLNQKSAPSDASQFRPPKSLDGQLRLF